MEWKLQTEPRQDIQVSRRSQDRDMKTMSRDSLETINVLETQPMQINAGKRCNYSRQRNNSARLSLCTKQ